VRDMGIGGTQDVNGIAITMTQAMHSGSIMEGSQIVYLGGAAGITAGGYAYTRSGWGGATALGATVLLLPLGRGLAEMKQDRAGRGAELRAVACPVNPRVRLRTTPATSLHSSPSGAPSARPRRWCTGRTGRRSRPARMGEAIRRQRGEMGV